MSGVGFVGLGAMGAPMALCLQRSGVEVTGYDVRRSVVDRLASEHGITKATDALALGLACSTVITMLPTSAHVESVIFGDRGLLDGMAPGALIIDMSSGQPDATRRIAARLGVHGVSLVDAPVSGNVARARKGDLTVMLGGAADDCARAEAVLGPVARTIYRTGPVGSGQAMKALNNLASAAGFWIASEVLTVGKKAGLDPQLMLEVLNASTGSNNSTQHKFKPFVLSGTYRSDFLLSLMVKDLAIASELIATSGSEATLALKVQELWAQAAAQLGAEADHTEVARYVAAKSGTTLGLSADAPLHSTMNTCKGEQR